MYFFSASGELREVREVDVLGETDRLGFARGVSNLHGDHDSVVYQDDDLGLVVLFCKLLRAGICAEIDGTHTLLGGVDSHAAGHVERHGEHRVHRGVDDLYLGREIACLSLQLAWDTEMPMTFTLSPLACPSRVQPGALTGKAWESDCHGIYVAAPAAGT